MRPPRWAAASPARQTAPTRSSRRAPTAATSFSRTWPRDSTSRSPRTSPPSTATSSRASAGADRSRGSTAARLAADPHGGASRAAADEPRRRSRSSTLRPTRSPRVRRPRRGVGGGVSLRDAKVVVSGGRGVGSSEAFEIIEELAGLLGGAVGCSRVVTSAGWRPHADQVGQTGTKISADLYVACGISGATQHIAGAKGAKKILAINSDPEAPIFASCRLRGHRRPA